MKLEILRAAVHLFTAEGYEHVSMRKIAAHIDYSATAIYSYFANKEEILVELLRHCYGEFLRCLQAAVKECREQGIEQRLRAALHGYIQFGLRQPQYYQLIFIDNLDQLQHVALPDNDRYEGFRLLEELVREAMEAGVLQRQDVRLVSQSLWASLHGTTSLLITFPGFGWDTGDFSRFQVEAMLRGL
ncbi:TetR/AcrR family transcriptional regulator [Ectobacillus ponti]|uniref:TetR/AcrR family transcriptional regulator n=1 Tax=Ectobacillus ponti TaxID=2961894 RepID=A0AA41X6R5_9BACI|nr:TetR/AcrR family transcriptional regulator [Ectobacillus ponti]MCP8969966.1 TetR/AcrR family transcriptional regulator [Ectobacillus ponti]